MTLLASSTVSSLFLIAVSIASIVSSLFSTITSAISGPFFASFCPSSVTSSKYFTEPLARPNNLPAFFAPLPIASPTTGTQDTSEFTAFLVSPSAR